MELVILDTNVIFAALYSRNGSSYKLLQLLPRHCFQIAMSVPLALEYEAILKKNFVPDRYTEQDIDAVVDYLCSIAVRKRIYYLWRPYLKDPFDDHILELAITANAKYIVTFNEKDFQNAADFGISVVTPTAFLELLKR